MMFDASIAPSAEPAPTMVCSSSMKRMTLLRLADFLHHGLDAFLELAAVFGAGDHEREVERDDLLVAQQLGHVARGDFLREAFRDRGLAHAGLADEDRDCSWCGGTKSG